MKQTYLAYDGINYKIGQSINPVDRINKSKTTNPNIKLLYYGYGLIEKELHIKFESKRIKREWFSLNQKDVDYIASKISIKNKKHESLIMESKMISQNKIGARINQIMIHYNLSKKELGKIINCSESIIDKMIINSKDPKIEFIVNIINHFKELSCEWLILGEGSMFKDYKYSNKTPNLKYIREKIFLINQEDFAKILNISTRTYQNYETGDIPYKKIDLINSKIMDYANSNNIQLELLKIPVNEEYKQGIDSCSDLEIIEHIAKNVERFKTLELFKVLLRNIDLDDEN